MIPCSSHVHKAILAAIKAGEAILEVYTNSEVEVMVKPDNTPLTVADKRAHQIIVDELESTQIPILSEEGIEIPFGERKSWNRFWLVDPLDGTKEFIKKNDEFTVNIALVENGSPVEGVIYVPVSRELFYTHKCKTYKTYVNVSGIPADEVELLQGKSSDVEFNVALSRSHQNQKTIEYLSLLSTNGKPLRKVQIGSSLKFCRLAEGKVDCYPKLGPTMEWDTAAGQAIAQYAGKNVYRMSDGKPLQYNKEDLYNPWFLAH